MANNTELALDPALIDPLDPFEYNPGNTDLQFAHRVIDYHEFDRLVSTGDRGMPTEDRFIATVRKVRTEATVQGLDPGHTMLANYVEYIAMDEHGPSPYRYRTGSSANLKHKITGIPAEGTRETRDTLEEDEPGARYYQWPNRTDITIVRYSGPKRGMGHIYRVCSNHTAVGTIHQILTTEARLIPAMLPQDDDPELWANVKTEYLDNGRYYRVEATHPNDHTVTGAFRKLDVTSLWEHVPVETLPDGSPVKTTHWRLFRALGDAPNIYFNNVTTGLTYKLTHRDSTAEATRERYTDTLGRTNGTWHFVEVLARAPRSGRNGEDGHNIVELWICCSPLRRILDRVIVKRFEDKFGRPVDDRNDQDGRLEARLHEKLTIRNSSFVIPLRGYSDRARYVDPEDSISVDSWDVIRMYIEFAEQGDLSNVIESFSYGPVKKHVPEIFVWLLLRNIVQACLSLEAENEVHLDIKPDNIFLRDGSHSLDYPGFCMPVLADFGMCLRKDAPIPWLTGTAGWLAPEQIPDGYDGWDGHGYRDMNKDYGKNFATTLHVYAIALVAWALMGRIGSHGLEQFRGPDHTIRPEDLLQFPNSEPTHQSLLDFPDEDALYSPRLDFLLRRCLVVDPAQRLSLVDLSHEVTLGLNFLKKRYPSVETLSWEAMPVPFKFKVIEEENFGLGQDVDEYVARRRQAEEDSGRQQ